MIALRFFASAIVWGLGIHLTFWLAGYNLVQFIQNITFLQGVTLVVGWAVTETISDMINGD